MTHPDLANPAVAKRAALALAHAIGPHCRIVQRPDGGKRVILGQRITDCATWLAVYSLVHAIRLDQVEAERRRAEPIPVGIYVGPAP